MSRLCIGDQTGCRNSNDLPSGIEQGTAAATMSSGEVDQDHAFSPHIHIGDSPLSGGTADPTRASNRVHGVSDCDAVRVTERDYGQACSTDLQQGNVIVRVSPDYSSAILRRVGCYSDLSSAVDYVFVGQQVAVGTHDETRARRGTDTHRLPEAQERQSGNYESDQGKNGRAFHAPPFSESRYSTPIENPRMRTGAPLNHPAFS
jgi:hypothetical protein